MRSAQHPAINFTSENSQDRVNFLDCTIIIDNNSLSTSLYHKPTDCHNYLNYDSHHPRHCKNSIPYSQVLRLRRICSDETDYNTQTKKLAENFRNCGYPDEIISKSIHKASYISRDEALVTKKRTTNRLIPLVLPFDCHSSKIARIIQKNRHILESDQEVGILFNNNIVTAYRNPPSLKQKLVHSAVKKQSLPGTFQCGRPRCLTCQHVVTVNNIQGPSGNFHIQQSFTCVSSALIYAIICIRCGELYIGQTGRRLADRCREHLGNIRRNTTDNDVARHFNSSDHSIMDVSITGLCYKSDKKSRETLESKLIHKLNTLIPLGMNIEP